MKIIGLLSWYEEDPAWLAECVAAAARVCDHIVAVDGAYVRFPGADKKPISSPEQARVIQSVAAGAGIGCTVHVPREAWAGNEVEKRDFMFRFASTFAEPDEDWFLVVDADEFVTAAPPGFRSLLKASDRNVAALTFWERGDLDSGYPLRRMYRAIPGIGIQGVHYCVTAPVNGELRVLSGIETIHPLEIAEDLTSIRLEHRKDLRTDLRKALKDNYYSLLPEIEPVVRLEELKGFA